MIYFLKLNILSSSDHKLDYFVNSCSQLEPNRQNSYYSAAEKKWKCSEGIKQYTFQVLVIFIQIMMWNIKEQSSPNLNCSSENPENHRNILQFLRDQKLTILRLKQQKQKIAQLCTKIRAMEDQARKKQEQTKRMIKQLYETKQCLTEFQAQFKEKVQMERQFKGQCKRMDDTIRSLTIENAQLKIYNQQLLVEKESISSTVYHQAKKIQEQLKANYEIEFERATAELKKLIERQNSALKSQNQECEELMKQNAQLESHSRNLIEELNKTRYLKQKGERHATELSEHLQKLTKKMSKHSESWQVQMQLEHIRLRMRELAKGEVDKIQFLTNNL